MIDFLKFMLEQKGFVILCISYLMIILSFSYIISKKSKTIKK